MACIEKSGFLLGRKIAGRDFRKIETAKNAITP